MNLYNKVEKVIEDHIVEHQEEVRKAKELLQKLDLVKFNQPDEKVSAALADGYSVHYYEYDRNDPNRPNPFLKSK
tara:strand:- start:1032 stop:1256 length:225 start_codon:yes stop_codon:yes gene_type:complete